MAGDGKDVVCSIKDVKVTLTCDTSSTPSKEVPPPPPKQGSLTPILAAATIFQAAIIGTFMLGQSDAGGVSFERLVEVQDEFIRTLRIENKRLRNRRPPSEHPSCTSKVYEAVDQLAAQVEERVKAYVKSEAMRTTSDSFGVTRAISGSEGRCAGMRVPRRAEFCD
jgi:hypothetical protein